MSLMPSRQCDESPAEAGIASSEVAYLNSALQDARSERNCAEHEKSRLAERLQALMNALPAAVLVLDGSGRVQESNPAAEALLQTSLHGQLWRELIQQLFLPQSLGGDVLPLRNGRLVTLSTRPLGSEPGQVLMLQDVTDTYQLRNRLEHFRRLADMGRMAASLAHQIRTPLSSAMLYVSHLKSPSLGEEKRERFAARAMGSLQGLEKLINDMLLFARDGQGQREPVEVHRWLLSLMDEFRTANPDVDIQLAQNNGTAVALINRVLLKSALQNLLNNAVQAGACRIVFQVREAGKQLEIEVADNGPGIAVEQQQRIFEPFVTGRSEGTGLGLSVVRAVAQSMGGDVGLHSIPGKGALFVIRLPLVPKEGMEAVQGVVGSADIQE